MKFSLYSKKNQFDEMQEQAMRRIEAQGFWLLWAGLLLVFSLLAGRFRHSLNA